MNNYHDDEENTFVCLDNSCLIQQKVFKKGQDMFQHDSHILDVRCLREIRTDIEKNSVIIDKFMIDHDFDKQSANFDEQRKVYQLKSKQLDLSGFFDGIKIELSNRFNDTRRIKTILNSLRTTQYEQMDLKGDLSFLKNVQDLPYLSKKINDQFTEKLIIQEFKQNSSRKKLFRLLIQSVIFGIFAFIAPVICIIGSQKDNKIKNGYRQIYYGDGAVYKGQWSNNQRNGQGEENFVDGDRYLGNYVEDKKQGQGEYYWANGDVYKGQWSNNQKKGQGECIWFNYGVYNGQWSNDQRNGQGKFKLDNDDRYVGNYVDDKKQGYGKYYWANGNVFKGQWSNDQQI